MVQSTAAAGNVLRALVKMLNRCVLLVLSQQHSNKTTIMNGHINLHMDIIFGCILLLLNSITLCR